MTDAVPQLLAGVRVIESSLLGPGLLTTFLADLGADVIKVEPPTGDYIRQMTWPIIDGVSLLHLHTHRGKRSVTLDLKTQEGVEVYRDLVTGADAVVEAMRPGTLERLGLGYSELSQLNPTLVYCTLSGYGATGPYADLPSHGIAYDTWAGLITPTYDDEGFAHIPREMPNVGINVGPMLGAVALLAGITSARSTGAGCQIELAQSDAAAYLDWYRIETWKAYERDEATVTGNASDNYERRPPGLAGMWDGVRYQIYASTDGHVLFMASEQTFWKNFTTAVDRVDLFEQWPGATYADHATGNRPLQTELRSIFATKRTSEWILFGKAHNVPIAPVNDPKTVPHDPQFQHRLPFYGADALGAEQLPLPVNVVGRDRVVPARAPEAGQHTHEVLAQVLGYDEARIGELENLGVLGK